MGWTPSARAWLSRLTRASARATPRRSGRRLLGARASVSQIWAMVENGCKLDVRSYNVIMGELCKEGKLDEATDLFEDMPRRGCTPDVVSYRILFSGLCEKMQLKEAAFLLDEMVFKGYTLHDASVYKFVDLLCQEGNHELLLTVLSSLRKGKAVKADYWTRMISLTCKNNEFSNAELVDHLINS